MARKQYGWHFITSAFFVMMTLLLTFVLYDKNLDMPWFDFLIIVLATFRLTHLFVYDTVMDFVRDYFEGLKTGFGKSMNELIHCPWCTGIWASLFIVTIYFLIPYSWLFILILGIAGAAIIVEVVVRIIWKNIPQ